MSWRPGRSLLLLGAMAVGLTALALAWAPAVAGAALVLLAGLGLVVFDLFDLRRRMAGLEIERAQPARVARGREFQIQWTIRSRRGAAAGELRDQWPEAARPRVAQLNFVATPAEPARLAVRVNLSRRGDFTFGPVWVRLRGRAGALEWQRRFEQTFEVKSLPPLALDAGTLLKARADELVLADRSPLARRRGEGLEFEMLSEFSRGDDVRRIAWRSSARHDRLLVRRYRTEQHGELMILVDRGRLMGLAAREDGSKLDAAVDAALLLGSTALERGDRCGVGVFDNEVRAWVPPRGGRAGWETLLEALYAVECSWNESHFGRMFATLQMRQRKRALVVVLTDIVDEATSPGFRAALATLGRRHIVVMAALQTPLLETAAREPIGRPRDVARTAAALRLLRDRESALHAIRRSGVDVLDVHPGAVNSALINRYLMIRHQSRL